MYMSKLVLLALLGSSAALSTRPCLLAARSPTKPLPPDEHEAPPPASAYTDGNLPMPITFRTIAAVATADLLVYLLLPEGARFGQLAQRIPRVTWSMLIVLFSLLTSEGTQPWLALLLTLLLSSSAATDLLWWLPYYMFTLEWERCSGGLFTKRVCLPHSPWDKFLLFALCLATGVFYTLSAIHSFGAFTFMRDEESERRMRRSFASALESGQGQPRR